MEIKFKEEAALSHYTIVSQPMLKRGTGQYHISETGFKGKQSNYGASLIERKKNSRKDFKAKAISAKL